MTYATHRSWVPFILTGITIAILVVFVAWGRPTNPVENTPVYVSEEVKPAPTQEEYKEEMNSILKLYDGSNAGQVYERLLLVTVPSEIRELHLQFVIAFGELKAGNEAAGEARLDLARSELGI